MKVAALALVLLACTNPESYFVCPGPGIPELTLSSKGYSGIQVLYGPGPLCPDGQVVGVRFTATSPAGVSISGTACCPALSQPCTVIEDGGP